MDRDTFWKIIDDARSKVDDACEVAELVSDSLADLPADVIVAFKQHQDDLLTESYRWDLWAVAYIINGGCSDDGFDYFRAWLMANGRARWESAMLQPDSIGEWTEEEAEDEEFGYVAVTAYETKTGGEFPYEQISSNRPSDPIGDPWEEDQLEELYPKLCEKFA